MEILLLVGTLLVMTFLVMASRGKNVFLFGFGFFLVSIAFDVLTALIAHVSPVWLAMLFKSIAIFIVSVCCLYMAYKTVGNSKLGYFMLAMSLLALSFYYLLPDLTRLIGLL